MNTEVKYRVVRAMECLDLEVDDTVSLAINDSIVTTTPPITASEIHSALMLGYLEPDVPTPSVRKVLGPPAATCPGCAPLDQSEAAAWFEEMSAALPYLPGETTGEHSARMHKNCGQIAAMVYGSGARIIRPAPPQEGGGFHPPLRLVG